jgi:hypothetical protein
MRLGVPGDRIPPGSCRTGENGGSEDRYRGRFFCSLARLVKRGPPLLRLLASPPHRTKPIAVRSRARRDSDGLQRHDRCHHEVPPEPYGVCSPTDRARRVFACPGPRVGSLGVAEVRSDITTLLPSLRLMARSTENLRHMPDRAIPAADEDNIGTGGQRDSRLTTTWALDCGLKPQRCGPLQLCAHPSDLSTQLP